MIRLDILKKKLSRLITLKTEPTLFENVGYCTTCASKVTFKATNSWLRDSYICSNCGSIPRERALMHVIETYFPNWRTSTIHESSPVHRGASERIASECKNYIPSQYFPDKKLGSIINGVQCQNLEALTFPDESIDLQITQDVMEHIFSPAEAFREIGRTLKPGGAHIFTVPLVNKLNPSKMRAQMTADKQIIHLESPIYHGNPINNSRSLVTIDWGFDICKYIFDACGLFTNIICIDDISKGIRAEYIEVLITFKPGAVN